MSVGAVAVDPRPSQNGGLPSSRRGPPKGRGPARVAALYLTEQAPSVVSRRPPAVEVDAPPPSPRGRPPLLHSGHPSPEPSHFASSRGAAAILTVVVVLRPGIELPVDQAEAIARPNARSS
jgi:hypothetical protein